MEQLIARIAKVPVTQRFAALVGFVLLCVGLTYVLAVSPVEDRITQFDNQIIKLDSTLAQKKAIARDLTRYRVEVERLKQRLSEALTLLPNEAEIPELLQKLASLVQQSDLTMRQFEPQSEVASGFYAKIPVKMSIVGNYHAIAIFFDKVAKLARIVNINDIKLKNPKIENKRVVLEAEFNATTFKFIEKKADAADAKGAKAVPKKPAAAAPKEK
ncbi:MAG: type 4a pilus biogenesis protein PilO [Myxococcota bacterium]